MEDTVEAVERLNYGIVETVLSVRSLRSLPGHRTDEQGYLVRDLGYRRVRQKIKRKYLIRIERTGGR